MSPTDLSETSLELLIMSDLTGVAPDAIRGGAGIPEDGLVDYDSDWVIGRSEDYARTHGVNTAQLFALLEATQPEIIADRASIPLVSRAATSVVSNRLRPETIALGVGFEFDYWNMANWNTVEGE